MLGPSKAVSRAVSCEARPWLPHSLPAAAPRAPGRTPAVVPVSVVRPERTHTRVRDLGRRCIASSSTPITPELIGGDSGNNGAFNGNGGGGGGGGGDGKGDSNQDPAVTALLLAAGRNATSFPSDFAAALAAGKVTADILKRYLEMESKFIIGWLMQFPGFRERLLADPGFLAKVAIEVGIGICTKVSAEYAKRQGHFSQELDFVAANVIMALIADFMLVWLPAPTLSYTQAAAGKWNWFGRMFAGCPENAFQKVQPGMQPFTLAQRFGAPVRNGLKLFGVGLSASFFGVALTNTLLAVRQMLDPTFVPLNQPQDVLAMSAAYGVYMATSSNLRYQVLAGVVEERGIEVLLKGNYKACAAASFVVRTANTFLGSLLWVDFIRLLGMQKAH